MTTIQAVRRALKTLAVEVLPESVQVVIGPRVSSLAADHVRIGDVRGQVGDPATLGPSRKVLEEYDVDVTISVTRSGRGDEALQLTVTDVAVGHYEAIEQAVRAASNMRLGAAGVDWAYVAGTLTLTESQASDTAGRANTTVTFPVHVRARYQLP